MLTNPNRLSTHDVMLITLDTLRFDVAERCHRQGLTPTLNRLLPITGWERRHTPGSFTFAAHQAFLAGFFPTPAVPGKHPRPFALAFPGSETITRETIVFDAPDLPSGFRQRGFHTLCVGGVGFFNPASPLGRVIPGLFDQAEWRPEFGVTDPRSTEHQVAFLLGALGELPQSRRVFTLFNVSALHQPNYFYQPGATHDSAETQSAALQYVDSRLAELFDYLHSHRPTRVFIMSDHGTAYGEDGFTGHRLAHPVVWDVPYAELLIGTDNP